MKFNLIRPCKLCPFRYDVPGYLSEERATEIAHAIEQGGNFACHQTTVDDEESGERYATADSQQCAGALICSMDEDGLFPPAFAFAARLGMFDPDKLDPASPVLSDFDEFIEHHSQGR